MVQVPETRIKGGTVIGIVEERKATERETTPCQKPKKSAKTKTNGEG